MVSPWAVYLGAFLSVALFIGMIVTGLELFMRNRIPFAVGAWLTAAIIATAASFIWNKATPTTTHLPLGGTVAGLSIFFLIGFGTVLVWSFIGDLLGREPEGYKKR
jgi:hypothetical protein